MIRAEINQRLKSWPDENDIQSTGSIHPTAKLFGSKIHGAVSIGEHTQVSYALIAGNDIQIGRFSSINGPNTTFYSEIHGIRVGNFTAIARNVDIQEWNHPITRTSIFPVLQRVAGRPFSQEIESKGVIQIGSDVWLGAQVVVVSGAEISHGCIVAANAVVTGYLPPYSIAAGNPARVIKYRFSPEVIEAFLRLAWWDWPVEKIQAHMDLFESDWRDRELELLKLLHEKLDS